jgi:hypothetical protein
VDVVSAEPTMLAALSEDEALMNDVEHGLYQMLANRTSVHPDIAKRRFLAGMYGHRIWQPVVFRWYPKTEEWIRSQNVPLWKILQGEVTRTVGQALKGQRILLFLHDGAYLSMQASTIVKRCAQVRASLEAPWNTIQPKISMQVGNSLAF